MLIWLVNILVNFVIYLFLKFCLRKILWGKNLCYILLTVYLFIFVCILESGSDSPHAKLRGALSSKDSFLKYYLVR